MCKRCQIYIFITLKKTCMDVLDRGERDKDNETRLKEGRVIEISTTVLPLHNARSLHLLSITRCAKEVNFCSIVLLHLMLCTVLVMLSIVIICFFSINSFTKIDL